MLITVYYLLLCANGGDVVVFAVLKFAAIVVAFVAYGGKVFYVKVVFCFLCYGA